MSPSFTYSVIRSGAGTPDPYEGVIQCVSIVEKDPAVICVKVKDWLTGEKHSNCDSCKSWLSSTMVSAPPCQGGLCEFDSRLSRMGTRKSRGTCPICKNPIFEEDSAVQLPGTGQWVHSGCAGR